METTKEARQLNVMEGAALGPGTEKQKLVKKIGKI